jgi:hypothetical protein
MRPANKADIFLSFQLGRRSDSSGDWPEGTYLIKINDESGKEQALTIIWKTVI